MLYVLRTTLTGAHALLTGRVVTDVTAIMDEHGFADAAPLVAAKRAGERVVLPDGARWMTHLERAFALLDAARETSILPEDPPNRDAMEDYLIRMRASRA